MMKMITNVSLIVFVFSGLVYADTGDWSGSFLQRLTEAAQSRKQSSAGDDSGFGSLFPFRQNSGQRNGARNSNDRLPKWLESSSENTDLSDWIDRYSQISGPNGRRDSRSRARGNSRVVRDQGERDWWGDYGSNPENHRDLKTNDWWNGFERNNEPSRNSQQNDWLSSLGKALPMGNRNDERNDWKGRNSGNDRDSDFKNFLDQIIGSMGMETQAKKFMMPKQFFRF